MPTTSDPPPWSLADGAVILTVRLTPRGGREALGGVVRDADGRPALQARVSAPPVDGAANKALLKLLAKRLGARRADIAFVSGETARIKRLRINGDPAEIAARLALLAG